MNEPTGLFPGMTKEITGKWRRLYRTEYDNRDFKVNHQLDFEMPTGKYFVICKECGMLAQILGEIPYLAPYAPNFEAVIRPRTIRHLPECSWSR
jgi:hypothetical protein